MEFQAYPSSAQSRKDRHILLRVQSALHNSDSVVLPACLLLVGSSLVVYQHFTDADTGRHSVRNFLMKLLASMLPLALLEKRIVACADPVELFAKFSPKVLMMHSCFLGLRLACLAFSNVNVGYISCNLVAFVGACLMLPLVFELRVSTVREHRDVWGLALVCAIVALVEVAMLGKFGFSNQWTRSKFVEDCIITGSDYIEILSFVPAVWMAWKKDSIEARTELADCQRRAVFLFVFLVGFYCVEDLVNAFQLRRAYPLASCGHVAHFLLLADFCTFLLAHIYEPEKFAKLRGAIAMWVADACAV